MYHPRARSGACIFRGYTRECDNRSRGRPQIVRMLLRVRRLQPDSGVVIQNRPRRLTHPVPFRPCFPRRFPGTVSGAGQPARPLRRPQTPSGARSSVRARSRALSSASSTMSDDGMNIDDGASLALVHTSQSHLSSLRRRRRQKEGQRFPERRRYVQSPNTTFEHGIFMFRRERERRHLGASLRPTRLHADLRNSRCPLYVPPYGLPCAC